MAHIGINAQLLSAQAGYRQAGIHHYILQLLNHYPKGNEMQYTVYTPQGVSSYLDTRFHVKESSLPTENPVARIAWEQTSWPLTGRKQKFDLMHNMAFVTPLLSSVPNMVTVYDLSFMHFPERYKSSKRIYLQTQTKRSCRSAKHVVTISQSAAEDIHTLFGIPKEKIDVIYPGVHEKFQPLPIADVETFKQQNKLHHPFILHVGTLQPRKNIPLLIDAFAQLQHPTAELILVGGKGWLYDEIFAKVQAYNLEDRVRFTGYVPEEDVPYWYNSADVLAFPSIYEGFGMPVAQAMACGTPVVASNSSSLPEVVGDAGFLFDPNSAIELAQHLDNILANPSLAEALKKKGFTQARSFSWQQSGQKMVNIYQKLL